MPPFSIRLDRLVGRHKPSDSGNEGGENHAVVHAVPNRTAEIVNSEVAKRGQSVGGRVACAPVANDVISDKPLYISKQICCYAKRNGYDRKYQTPL